MNLTPIFTPPNYPLPDVVPALVLPPPALNGPQNGLASLITLDSPPSTPIPAAYVILTSTPPQLQHTPPPFLWSVSREPAPRLPVIPFSQRGVNPFEDLLDKVYTEIRRLSFTSALQLLEGFSKDKVEISEIDTKSEAGVVQILKAYIYHLRGSHTQVDAIVDHLPIYKKSTSPLYTSYENLLWLIRAKIVLKGVVQRENLRPIITFIKKCEEIPAPLEYFHPLVLGIAYYKAGEYRLAKEALSTSHRIHPSLDALTYLSKIDG